MYQPKVYLGGPIQHAQDNGKGWRALVKENYDECSWVDPLDTWNTHDEYKEWTDIDIVEDDLFMLDDCRGLLVHWEEVATCGTPMEMRYAYNNNIFTVVQTTIPKEKLSPWLRYHVNCIVETFDEAVNTLSYGLLADRG